MSERGFKNLFMLPGCLKVLAQKIPEGLIIGLDATVDAEDVFFMVLLREDDKPQFVFIWEGTKYTFN